MINETNTTAPQQEEQQKPNARVSGNPRSYKDTLSRQNPGMVAQGGGGEYFVKIREAIVADIPNIVSSDVEMQLLAINRQEFKQLKFSCVVFVSRLKDVKDVVAYHTVILEATGEKLQAVHMNIDNRSIPVRRVVGDAADVYLIDLVRNQVMSLFPGYTTLDTGYMALLNTVKPTDDALIENLVHIAGNATVSEIFRAAKKFEPLTLRDFGQDARLVIDVGVGGGTTFDALGNPVRSSTILSMNAVDNNAPRNMAQRLDVVNAPEQSTNICTVNGFLNPVWADPGNQLLNNFGNLQQQQIRQPKLQAEFVITGIDSLYLASPAAVMLAVSSVYALSDNNNWVQLLLPIGNKVVKDGDMDDIGGLNVICDTTGSAAGGIFAPPISVEKIRNDLAKVSTYVGMLFRSGMMVSIDCQECGPSSWYTNLFIRAASGDRDSMLTIIESIDTLTDGIFSTMFDSARSSIFSSMIRISNGVHMLNSQRRDIRDVDLTAITNRFSGNATEIHNYINTFDLNRGISEPTQVTIRESYIEHALANQCEITGYSRRLTFSKEFLEAFSASINACKVNTVVNTPLAAEQLRVGMVAPSHIGGSVIGSTHTFNNIMGGINRPAAAYGIPGNYGINRR